jgi:CelD/BcsL family acetyltransferase involved in cellulose biosynthesis
MSNSPELSSYAHVSSVIVLPARDLSTALAERWSELQLCDSALASPFFRPEFTMAVGAVRNDAFFAVLEEGNTPRGFLPFQRQRRGIGKPIGAFMSDYQGVVAEPGLSWEPLRVVNSCGLRAWNFDHLIASQLPFKGFHQSRSESPYLELANGFEAYRRDRAGSQLIPTIRRRARKLEREVGDLRFVAAESDLGVLRTLQGWKSHQYRETGVPDIFALGWPTELLEHILAVRQPEFSGMLSALYAGDELVAGHMGMRSRDTWHWWFPAYAPRFARYSPGLILLLHMAAVAASIGVRRIDLGKGNEPYKHRFKSAAVPLAVGSVASRPLRARRQVAARARAAVLCSPAGGTAKAVANSVRRRTSTFH